MQRKPFNPSLARGGLFDGSTDGAPPRAGAGAPASASTEPAPLTVTQACDRLRGALETTGRLRILGEVSNFTPRSHWYFSIKDANAVLNCVMWASVASRAAFQISNGMEVVVTGSLTYYGPSARTQLVVDKVERRGQGSLQQRFEELCRVLRSEGYFDEARKRALPTHPRRVAVITARHGAALQDVIRTARLRAPFVRLLVVEVAVQGQGAAAEIAQAIRAVDRRADELGIDAMIVTRGGGSLEDLWAFNERAVADAVFNAVTPIVAAIGHETDTTVIELVADRRASTPTQAAMLLLPDGAQLAEQADHLADRLSLFTRKRLREATRELDSAARHPIFRQPRALLVPHRARLAALQGRLTAAPRVRWEQAARQLAEARTQFEQHRPAVRHAVARQRLHALEARLSRALSARASAAETQLNSLADQLRVLGPQQVLSRGYSLTFTARGQLVRRAADAPVGTPLATRVSDGTIRSTVDDAQEHQ